MAVLAQRPALNNRMERGRIGLQYLFLLLAVAFSGTAARAGDSPFATEDQLKAAFLYNFAKFVEWPESAAPDNGKPLTIGVVGDSQFVLGLAKSVSGKSIGGRSIAVEQINRAEDARQCQILFISGSDSRRTSVILKSLEGLPILTVGETSSFIESGGMINFVLGGSRLQFEANVAAADRAAIRLSSKLLRLALNLRPEVYDAR